MSSLDDDQSKSTGGLWSIGAAMSLVALLVGGVIGYWGFSPAANSLRPSSSDAAEIKRVLASMDELLKAGNERDFLVNYAPVAELRKLQWAEGANEAAPTVPRDDLRFAIGLALAQEPTMDASGQAAEFELTSPKPINAAWSLGPGYEGDVSTAIKAAITDIEKGQIKTFIRNMFPPDALRAMFSSGIEYSPVPFVEKESAIMELMLKDLRTLQSMRPQIKEGVAEFTLPPIAYSREDTERIRPGAERFTMPDRVIRFSLINDRWRFFDDGSYRRSGAIAGASATLKLERVENSWRLVNYPY